MKNPKHNPLHLERAYLAHFPLVYSIFNKFEYTKWRTTKLFEVSKGIDYEQENHNNPISINVW